MARMLPAGTCLRHAVNSVRNNLGFAFRISWPWYAILIVLSIILFGIADVSTTADADLWPFIVPFLALMVVSLLAVSSIAVTWHRYILLDEVPKGFELLRLDDKAWRYFGNLLLILIILVVATMVMVVPLVVIASFLGANDLIGVVIALIATPFAGILSLRLGVKLPAIALGRRDFLMSHAWAATQANNLPLFFVFLFQFAAYIGAFLLTLLLGASIGRLSPALWTILDPILQLAFNWILMIFGVTVLTSLYGFFVENRDF